MNLLKLTQTIMQKLGYDEATDTISIAADNFSLKDSVLQINSAETGDGITTNGGLAGIEIYRGPNLPPAKIFYSETEQCFKSNLDTDTRVLGLSPAQDIAITNIVENPEGNFDRQKHDTEMFLNI